MNSPPADPGGAISLRLRTRDAAVVDVVLDSSRPTGLAQRLFAGRPVDGMLQMLPLVFSVCATAQASAAVQACEAAVGVTIDPLHRQARDLLVAVETAREHLLRILTGWGGWLRTPPDKPALATLGRLRAAWGRALYPAGDAFRCGGGRLQPDSAALHALVAELEGLVGRVLGLSPADLAAMAETSSFEAWVHGGDALAQRMLAGVLADGQASLGAVAVALLPPFDDAAVAARLAADDVADFVARPTWHGHPCETGALEREQRHPLVAVLTTRHGHGLLTRLVARLAELAAIAGQLGRTCARLAAAGPQQVTANGGGAGVAQVAAARGRLVHAVELCDGTVTAHRVLAPTEWNFHPEGALTAALRSLPVDVELAANARLLVEAVDPCVACRVEVVADA